MSRLVLVRHGHAAAGWGDDADPGLDDLGRRQSAEMATVVAPLGPLPVIVSGLRRCRETAAALCEQWGIEPRIDSRVEEVPTPPGMHLAARSNWLQGVMAGSWAASGPELSGWCDDVVECLLEVDADTVVVTHFIAINVAIGRATGDDRVTCRVLDNCSRTVLDNRGGRLEVLELGAEARTEVW